MDRSFLKDKKRIVVKIGTTTITHVDTGHLNLIKMEKLARVLTDIRNQNKEIVIVSSGAIGAGRKALGMQHRPRSLAEKQACGGGPGKAYDDLSEAFCGVQSDHCADSDNQKNYD